MKDAILSTTVYATYKTPAEAVRTECVLKTLEAARDHDYPIVIIDGGSPTDYVEIMESLGGIVISQEIPGMGNARRQALRAARSRAGRGGEMRSYGLSLKSIRSSHCSKSPSRPSPNSTTIW